MHDVYLGVVVHCKNISMIQVIIITKQPSSENQSVYQAHHPTIHHFCRGISKKTSLCFGNNQHLTFTKKKKNIQNNKLKFKNVDINQINPQIRAVGPFPFSSSHNQRQRSYAIQKVSLKMGFSKQSVLLIIMPNKKQTLLPMTGGKVMLDLTFKNLAESLFPEIISEFLSINNYAIILKPRLRSIFSKNNSFCDISRDLPEVPLSKMIIKMITQLQAIQEGLRVWRGVVLSLTIIMLFIALLANDAMIIMVLIICFFALILFQLRTLPVTSYQLFILLLLAYFIFTCGQFLQGFYDRTDLGVSYISRNVYNMIVICIFIVVLWRHYQKETIVHQLHFQDNGLAF